METRSMSARLWRHIARAWPLGLSLVASVAALPFAWAATCTGCGTFYRASTEKCVSGGSPCFTPTTNPYYKYVIAWDRSDCANGYKITYCFTTSSGCCGSLFDDSCPAQGDHCS
jgi:hypothetical protein